MKKIICLLIVLLTVAAAFAQSFTVQQTTAYASGDPALTYFDVAIKVYNNAPANNTLRWIRTQQIMPPTWRTSVCNASYCFPMSTDTAVFTMTPGDSDEVNVHFYPFNTNGSAIVTIKLYAVNNSADSVTLTFYGNTTTGINENEALNILLFPNPADDKLNIRVNENIQIVEVFNMLGERVRSADTERGRTIQMHIGDLPAGWYAVRIRNEKGMVSAKRFIKNNY